MSSGGAVAGVEAWAPAKVNLTLRIVGRRPDGYHELESIFQALSLCDRLEISAQPERIHLEVTRAGGWAPARPEENLAWQAADLLRRKQAPGRGAHMRLTKRIPAGAGLGGGSSDAAATLLALNSLWELGLERAELAELGAELGSDVPFFVYGGTALARGRGELVEPLEYAAAPLCMVLTWPEIRASTAEAYAAWDRAGRQGSGPELTREMIEALRQGEVRAVGRCLGNDLEEVVLGLYPSLRATKQEFLEAGCVGAVVCGSGSALVGLAPREEVARALWSRISERGAWAAVVWSREAAQPTVRAL